ncbi:glycosyltransferase family 2 protein [Pedobacter heparinus]|uniref:glycosyltransferase family 2 protein n=1 Tax=Pedobacter heparinus TaxID=984 RepID=UPI00292E208D|nr:glycosyltransferase [Pedobacter heparinus]
MRKDIKVSICCLTYNHERYIAQAIEGFLMQKTNFPFEIIVGEDCSTDHTRIILEDYKSRYPDQIRLITSTANVGANVNAVRVFKAAGAEYIAVCDGDDYWTDPLKLQKQIDFLEQNEDYVMCGHYSKRISENDEIHYMNFNPKPLIYSFDDVMSGNKTEISTLTIVFRNTREIQEMFDAEWFTRCNAPDKFIKLYTTFISGKRIYIMPETMSCYRQHAGGMWSSLKPRSLKQKELNDLYMMIRIFKYTWIQKGKLFFFYLKKYFLFELREHGLQETLSTIRTIW